MSDLTELHRSIGRIEGKIDTFIEQMKVQDDRHGKLEGRVRRVENKQYWLSGAGAVVGGILAWFTKSHMGA